MYPYKFSFFTNQNINDIISKIESDIKKEDNLILENTENLDLPLILFEDKGLFFAVKENAYLFSKISINQ